MLKEEGYLMPKKLVFLENIISGRCDNLCSKGLSTNKLCKIAQDFGSYSRRIKGCILLVCNL